MNALLILGAGQYGLVAKEIAEAMGCFDNIEFLDDDNPIAVGKLEDIERLHFDSIFISIGNPEIRARLTQRVLASKYNLVSLIHPMAYISPSASICTGCIVEAGAAISSNSMLGVGCIVMANVVVGHDAHVGAFCQLKYNSTIAERAILPDGAVVKANAMWE